MLEELTEQAKLAVEQVLDAAKLERGGLFVVGCSSSEVCGSKIGTNSSLETAQAVFAGIYPVLKERGIYLAAQCCEHLNRAIIIEREAAQKFGYEEVNVVPQPKAGGSFATTAYATFAQPVAVEEVHADAGWILAAHSLACISSGWRFPSALQSNKLGRRTCFVHGRGQNLSAACGHTMMKANYEPAYWTRGAVQRDAPRPCILKKHVLYSVL